jgi:hypothetical protein
MSIYKIMKFEESASVGVVYEVRPSRRMESDDRSDAIHKTKSTYISQKQNVHSVMLDVGYQSSSWKNVGPVACGGAVEGPASAISISPCA